MAETFENNHLKITLKKKGFNRYTKISFPVKYGIYSEIETDKYIFQFNLEDEIVRAKSKDISWINPSEWLKRTMGNDWIYYSTGGYSGVFEAIGEYYLPNFQYSTNSLIGGKPFKEHLVCRIVTKWHEIIKKIDKYNDVPGKFNTFIKNILDRSDNHLSRKAEKLFKIIHNRASVLPPDARHVDYDIIPVNISLGCLYHCRFCRVKTRHGFSLLSRKNITCQIKSLKRLYGKDIINYNSIFLGEHDGLNAPVDLIVFAAEQACYEFDFRHSYMGPGRLFLFGSVDALLGMAKRDFEKLCALPFYIHINIGLESADQETLDLLGKPLSVEKIREAYIMIRNINIKYDNIEISSNFIFDDTLPENHYTALLKLVDLEYKSFKNKGDIYLSPLHTGAPSRAELYKFNYLKMRCPVPTFLYIIQRL